MPWKANMFVIEDGCMPWKTNACHGSEFSDVRDILCRES